MTTRYNDRPVKFEIEFRDCPEDSFISEVWYTDATREMVSEYGVEELQANLADVIEEAWAEHMMAKAEYNEGDR